MNNHVSVRLFLLFAIVLIVDQATKYIALTTLQMGVPVDVFGDYVRWTLAYNPGGAFGTRLGSSNYYLITSLVIFFALAYYIYKNRYISHISIPLSIVAGGAVGNIVDRLRFGEVVDFIDCEFPDFSLGSYHMERWPIFNVADVAVSCGILATIILILYYSMKEKKQITEASLSLKEETIDNE